MSRFTNSSIAKTYAKAFFELGQGAGDKLLQELETLVDAIRSHNDLENVLFLDVFTTDEKLSVLGALKDKMNFSKLTEHLLSFLVDSERMGLLPLIYKEMTLIQDKKLGRVSGMIEGADGTINNETLDKFISILSSKLGRKVQLNYKQNGLISAGYRVSVEDFQLDATLDHQLDRFKNS